MPAEKSYLNVATIPYEDGRINLKITLRHKATEAFIGCYRMAFYRRCTGFTTFIRLVTPKRPTSSRSFLW